MKVLFCVLVLISVCSEGAMAARWEKREVPVWDFTSDEWRPYVQESVADFNDNLPPKAPHLIYVSMGELPCSALRDYGKKGGITVCVGDTRESDGYTWSTHIGAHLTRAIITIAPANPDWSSSQRSALTCHEMMHAVTDVPDDYSAPHGGESCVQGWLDHLGSWDITYAAEVYAHHPKHTRKRHR